VNQESGLLSKEFCLPISGEYPKDAAMFPDNRHIVSLNHGSNTLTFFEIDQEKNVIMMCAPAIKVHRPNCIAFYKVEG